MYFGAKRLIKIINKFEELIQLAFYLKELQLIDGGGVTRPIPNWRN